MIDNPRSEAMTLDTFQYLADAYGANLERWPKAMLPAATRLFASSAPARAVLAEAQALDRLLDTPPPVVTSNATDLAERIIAAATTAPTAQAGPGNDRPSATVVRLPSRSLRPNPLSPPRTGTLDLPLRKTGRFWPVAAALAASLALGITLGAHDLTHGPVRGLVAIASADADTDVDRFVAALHADGIASGTDEERQ